MIALLLLLQVLPTRQSPDFCHSSDPAPARDLYCMELTPVPDFPAARGMVQLDRAASPYGIAVTATGVQRFRLVLTLEHLPSPAELGPYRRYFAWVTTPTFDTLVPLGPVSEGRQELAEVAFNKFLVLISAEPADTATSRRGRLLLRGASPSNLMHPHGANMLPPSGTGESHRHSANEGWRMPDPHPGVSAMTPGLEGLRPEATPYLPRSPSPLPRATPGRRLQLADGDTVELVAGMVERQIAGRRFTALAFNGQYPGPLFEVPERATVTVVFRNHLDLPSTIHWHGLRLDNRFDGVPGMTQEAVPPGGTFVYTVHFPDPGLFWYHPHVREDIQQELGLYGNLLVRSPDPDYFGPADREAVLVLDDLLEDDAGPLPFGLERSTHSLMGRFGNRLLVNGEPAWHFEAGTGEVVRLLLTNVSNVRTWNLVIPGARMKVVAGDQSRFEHEAWVDQVVIAPAERYVLSARFEHPGRYPLLNQVQGLDHRTGVFLPESDTLGWVTVTESPPGTAAGPFSRLQSWPDIASGIRDRAAAAPVRTLQLTMRVHDLPFGLIQALRLDTAFVNPVEWSGTMPMMDWLVTAGNVEWVMQDLDTGRENMDIHWRFPRNSLARIRLVNDRHTLHAMQHPIHLHGQRFLVLAQNEVATENLVWKDTALVPAGGTLDLLVEFTNPGTWMLHCHIAEHLEAGMHMGIVVE